MQIGFRYDVPLEDTMDFEMVHEPNLRLTFEDKEYLLASGKRTVEVWMYVDGELAGECYGIVPQDDDEGIEDIDTVNTDGAIYCYSTTLLPRFQGKGLSKLLVATFNARAAAKGYTQVLGHATSAAMYRVRYDFGAIYSATHHEWYGTNRIASFYVQPL